MKRGFSVVYIYKTDTTDVPMHWLENCRRERSVKLSGGSYSDLHISMAAMAVDDGHSPTHTPPHTALSEWRHRTYVRQERHSPGALGSLTRPSPLFPCEGLTGYERPQISIHRRRAQHGGWACQ